MARDFYKNPNLKREDVEPTRLVDFENIAKQFKVNIRLFESAKESETVWKLVFGKNQFKKNMPCVDIGLFVYEGEDLTRELNRVDYNRETTKRSLFLHKRH